MKQLEDTKTADMFNKSTASTYMTPAPFGSGAALRADSFITKNKPSVDSQLARAISTHVKYVNSFSRTGTWLGSNRAEYWSESLERCVNELEMKRLIRSHMTRTLKKIKEITK